METLNKLLEKTDIRKWKKRIKRKTARREMKKDESELKRKNIKISSDSKFISTKKTKIL
jgi:hypothetical protein